MGMKYIILALLLLGNSINIIAGTEDTASVKEHYSIFNGVLTANRINPAFMYGTYKYQYSEMYAYTDNERTDRPILYQLGDGHSDIGIEVNSYVKLSKSSIVWGEASYRSGKKYNLKWNSTTDYALLYPYVMGDTLGGNLNNERYTFAGGYAIKTGKFTIGQYMKFRAEHEYRTTDPRPRGIVTDLSLRFGVSYDYRKYIIGAGLGGIFYKQTNSVSFFREEGVIPEYQMVGLGMDYKRFSGSNTSAYYKATGISADVSVKPIDGDGAYISATYDYTPYRRILPNLNSLPVTTLYLYHYTCELGWKHISGVGWSGFAGINYEKRTGDEHVAGSSSSTEYAVITDMTMYRSHNADYYLGGALNIKGLSLWNIIGKLGYMDYGSKYVYPVRSMSFSKVHGNISAQMIRDISNDIIVNCNVSSSYYMNVRKNMSMPYATMDYANTNLMEYTYVSCTDNYLTTYASIRMDYNPQLWKQYGMFVELGGGIIKSNSNNGYKLYLSMGITF